MKKCSKCKKDKDEQTNFYSDKRTHDGLYSACKECHQLNNTSNQARARILLSPTPEDVAYIMFTNIVRRIVNHKRYQHIKCLFSQNELREFLIQDWGNYMNLHNVWRMNGFERKHMPSIDRIDSKGNYELGNIQIISVCENSRRGGRENLGKKFSPERVQKLIGKTRSPEHRKAISEGQKKRHLRNKITNTHL